MFEVKSHKVIIQDLHKITNNYTPLLNDGYYDVIYFGTNPYGNQILGVIMFDDDDNEFLRFIHILITDRQYNAYINRKISLRAIIDENRSVFLVDKKYNGKEIDVNLVAMEEIPNEFLPLSNSFCPEIIGNTTFNYAVSLKGNLADLHIAEPDDINNVNHHISSFIRAATNFVSELELDRRVYVEGMVAGSFKINFKVEVKQVFNSLFNVPLSELSEFMNSYFRYVFEKLPHEEIDTFKSEEIKSPDFLELQKAFHSLHNSAGNLPVDGVEQRLIDNLNYAIENLKSINYGRSFDRIEFISYTNSGVALPNVSIDDKFYGSVSNKFFPIEKITKEDVIELDETLQEYSIQVYSLNKETGNGGAYLNINEGIHKIGLHLRGRTNYQNTLFTHNMDEKEPKMIKINAIAKKVNGRVVELTYNFDKI